MIARISPFCLEEFSVDIERDSEQVALTIVSILKIAIKTGLKLLDQPFEGRLQHVVSVFPGQNLSNPRSRELWTLMYNL